MRDTFEAFFPHLMKQEGGFVNHPRDPGGMTNLGVTKKRLEKSLGRSVSETEMRALTPEKVKPFYFKNYWTPIKANDLPLGPDAVLFDVSVNSGPDRAKSWTPIIEGKTPVEAVKALSARRRNFFRSLATFDVFGKGWMRRVVEVEAWALKAAAGASAPAVVKQEKAASIKEQKKATVGAVVTTGTTGATPVMTPTPSGNDTDWVVLLAVGIPVALLLGFFIYQLVIHSMRSGALDE